MGMSSDIKPKWISLIRRLQQMARSQNGIAEISLTVLVDQDGNPLTWLTPDLKTYEPCVETTMLVSRLLAKDQL